MIAEAASQSGTAVALIVGAIAVGLAVVQARRRTLSRRRPAEEHDPGEGTGSAAGPADDAVSRDPAPPGPPPAGS